MHSLVTLSAKMASSRGSCKDFSSSVWRRSRVNTPFGSEGSLLDQISALGLKLVNIVSFSYSPFSLKYTFFFAALTLFFCLKEPECPTALGPVTTRATEPCLHSLRSWELRNIFLRAQFWSYDHNVKGSSYAIIWT